MALGGAAWRNETRAWRRAMLKTPRPNTDNIIHGSNNQKYNKDLTLLPQMKWLLLPAFVYT